MHAMPRALAGRNEMMGDTPPHGPAHALVARARGRQARLPSVMSNPKTKIHLSEATLPVGLVAAQPIIGPRVALLRWFLATLNSKRQPPTSLYVLQGGASGGLETAAMRVLLLLSRQLFAGSW